MSENEIEKARKNSKGGNGDISGATNLTFKQRIATNDYTKNKLTYTNFDDGVNRFSVPHFRINAFQDESGKTLNPNSSIDIICTESLGEVADMGNVWLGNKRLTVEDQKRIAATGQNQAKIYMPLDMEALSRGEYKPNMEVAKLITAANEYIKDNNIETEEGKQEVYKDYGVDIYLNEKNVENSPYFGAFLAVQSFTQGAFGMADKDSRVALREFDPKDKDIYLEAINRNINQSKDGKKDWSAGWFRNKDLYEGMVYIHLNDDPIVASGASNNLNIAKSTTSPNYIRGEAIKNERQVNINNLKSGTNILDQ
jgi:hypothetical protein